MFSLWDDFKLGMAGVGDLVGLTDGAAARTFAEQEAAARNLDTEAAAELEARAIEADKREGIVRKAAEKTAESVAAPIAAAFDWIKWAAWGVGLVAVGGFGIYALHLYGPREASG